MMNLTNIFLEKSRSSKSGIFFIESGQEEEFLSYNELRTRALQVLFFLQQEGLKPKDELVLQIEENKKFVIIFWACILGGIIPVPLSTGKNDDHRKKLFQVWSLLNNPSLIISNDNLQQVLHFGEKEGLHEEVTELIDRSHFIDRVFCETEEGTVYGSDEKDIAFLQFSSGSTGSPKGVVLTHANLIANIEGITLAASYSEQDTMLSWMPLSHDMGMIGFHINPLIIGINQYLMPTGLFIRNPRLWLDKIAEHRISITCSPNFGYRYFLKNLRDDQYSWDLSGLRIIYNGAEPISEGLCIEFNERLSKYGLKNTAICPVYGLAEASVAVCISDPKANLEAVHLNRHRLNPGDKVENILISTEGISLVNVGKPVYHCAVQITNPDGLSLGENTIGNIRIKGRNVTSGYYNAAALFERSIDQEGWLDTGDLGFLRDGALYITGRVKDVIFANGQNYYSHDIEKEAESVEGIELNKLVVFGALSAETQTEEVVGFLLHRGALENLVPVAVALKQLINEKFGFEIHKIIPVREIPKTTSGKLKRYELMNRYRSGDYEAVAMALDELLKSFNKGDFEAPSTAVERDLLGIWQEIFQHEDFGVNHNFFHIGGNSLKAAEFVMRLQQQLQVELPFERLYKLQTIRKIAAEIANLQHKVYEPIPVAAEADSWKVSSSQRRIYYAWKINPDAVTYNIPQVIKLKGILDIKKLEGCLQQLIGRHDALRMTFYLEDEPWFRISEQLPVQLAVVTCSVNSLDKTLEALIIPFDLTNGPLYRFVLIEDRYNDEWFLFLDFHHIISDGRSVYLFVQELLQLYNRAELPALGTSFRDFACWEHRQKNQIAESVKRYWTEQFSGEIPVLELPFDFQRPAMQDSRGKRLQFTLNKEISLLLNNLCKAKSVSKHSFLFTAYNILLAKYSGQEDLVTGIPSHGRTHPDLQNVHGMFVNNLPIRNFIDGEGTFVRLLERNFELISLAIDHQDWSFDNLVNALELPSNPGRNPLFDTMFLYQDWALGGTEKDELRGEKYPFDPGISKFDLSMEIIEDGDSFTCEFEYATSLFNVETIVRLSQGFEQIIRHAIADPEIRIADLSPLNEFETIDFMPIDHGDFEIYVSVSELFESQVKRKPSDVALEFEGKEFTFEELDARARLVASALRHKGVRKSDLIGIHLKRSPELVATILGIMKAGAAYLPLEHDTPAERIRYILEDSKSKFLISNLNPEMLIFDNGFSVEVSAFDSLIALGDSGDIEVENRATDLAYVIYTSGSTGTPKGVMINHESLSNYITWAGNRYTGSELCVFALYSSISFDLTITSIFTPLVTGNKIIIYGEDDTDVAIESVVKHNKADVVKLTPAHLKLLMKNGLLSATTKIKTFIVGGEAFDSRLAKEVDELTNGKIEIFNEYGPTEATVGCMIYQFNTADASKTVPIGKPIRGVQIYLLDKYLKPVPIQVQGEIYITGRCLAQGYLFRDELTAERFIESPCFPGLIMYKTGDIAKRLPDGNMVYIGRNDNQVKISGNRVELSEIEAQLVNFSGIGRAVVLVDVENNNSLNAYIQSDGSERTFSDMALRNYLAERLPYFMIPKKFIPITVVPLTKNGKIDVVRLKKTDTALEFSEKKSPESTLEKIFIKIWEEVLKTTGLGTTDNFFEQGGDSIKAVQISSKLFEQGISVKVKDILTYHTIKNISLHAETSDPSQIYEQGILNGELTASPIQSWFFKHDFNRPGCYTQSALFKVNESLNISALEETLDVLIAHHDTLRLNYNWQKKNFFYNNDHLNTRITLTEIPVSEEQSLDDICNGIRNSFDLSSSLLLKAALLKKKDGAMFLFITAHHLIIDGISWRILLQDMYSIYSAIQLGKTISLPPKTASFRDWTEMMTGLSISKEFEQEKEYWKEMERCSFSMVQDIAITERFIKNTRTIVVSLDQEKTAFLLKDAHKPYNTDVLIILNAALLMTLKARTGFNEFVIEQENHGRGFGSLNVSRTIGWFTAVYPVKFVYKSEVGALIKSVKETLRKVPHKGIGYGINAFLSDDVQFSGFFPELRLNYLGELGKEMNNPMLSLSSLNVGNESHPDNVFTTYLECNAWVTEGTFIASMTGSMDIFKGTILDEFSNLFLENLNLLLRHLKEEEEGLHFTPSDFPSADLEEEEIQNLFND